MKMKKKKKKQPELLYGISNSSMNIQMPRMKPKKHHSQTHLLPFRLTDIRDRKNPVAGPAPPGNLSSTSPISWANSVPGKSMSLVILLTTNSVNTSGFSWRSFSTKKSGLKIMGWPRREESLQITKLQMASLKKMKQKNLGVGLDHFHVFLMPSQPHSYSLFLWVNLHIGLLKNLILNLVTVQKKTIWTCCCLSHTHLDT